MLPLSVTMGRKRGLPARAREKLVAEEAAAAIDLDRKEAVLQAKPDEALFVLDAAGVCDFGGWAGLRKRELRRLMSTEHNN